MPLTHTHTLTQASCCPYLVLVEMFRHHSAPSLSKCHLKGFLKEGSGGSEPRRPPCPGLSEPAGGLHGEAWRKLLPRLYWGAGAPRTSAPRLPAPKKASRTEVPQPGTWEPREEQTGLLLPQQRRAVLMCFPNWV